MQPADHGIDIGELVSSMRGGADVCTYTNGLSLQGIDDRECVLIGDVITDIQRCSAAKGILLHECAYRHALVPGRRAKLQDAFAGLQCELRSQLR